MHIILLIDYHIQLFNHQILFVKHFILFAVNLKSI